MVILFAISLTYVSAASDTSVNNSTSNSNIQNTIDDVDEGATVIFEEGNYTGINLTINKSVNIKGNGNVNFIYSDNNVDYMIHITNSTFVNISGINFIGSDDYGWNYGYMILVDNSSNIQIKDCKFINATYAIFVGDWYWYEDYYNAKNVVISNNSFKGCGLGVFLYSANNVEIIYNNFTNNINSINAISSNLTIERNNITNSNDIPIYIDASTVKISYNNITNNLDSEYIMPFSMINVVYSNITITYNNISSNGNKSKENSRIPYAIFLEGVINVLISNNLISNNIAGIHIENYKWDLDEYYEEDIISNITIEYNNITNNVYNGIRVIGVKDAVIRYNNIFNNGKNGITIIFSSNCDVSYNNITNNKGIGIILTDYIDDYIPIETYYSTKAIPASYRGNSTYCNIYNNNISNNRIGVTLEGGASFNTIRSNIIYNNSFAGALLNRSSAFNNITSNDFVDNEYGVLIDMYGNDSDYTGWEPENIPNFSVNDTTIEYNRFFKNAKALFVLNNDDQDHNNMALANWFGNNNPEIFEGINNINWFIVNYTINTTTAKVGDTVSIAYEIVINDGSSANSMRLPYFALNTLDSYNVIPNISLSSLNQYDARISTTFIKTLTETGTFYSRALVDFEDMLVSINIEAADENIEDNPTDFDNTTDISDPIISNDPSDNIDNQSNGYGSISAKTSMKSTGMPLLVVILVLLASLGLFARKK